MKIAPFTTEQFFARYEFSTPHALCNSDCESLSIAELLEMAGDSLQALGREPLGYTPSPGHPDLRSAIARCYQRVSPDRVLALGSPIEGIYLAARTLLQPGDEVIVPAPAYDALVNLFEHVTGKEQVRRWHFRPDGSSWSLDLDELQELVTARTRLLVVNFPHNPTGHLPSEDWLEQLVAFAEERGLRLFCDEMYFGLTHRGTPQVPSLADLSRRAVVLSGLSKTHGLPGLRCGWLVLPDETLWNEMHNWKFYTSICSPVPSQYLALAALRIRETLRQRSLSIIESNLAHAEAFFARWPDRFDWRRPRAGSTALVGFDVPSVSALAERLAREEGVLIQSAAMLGGSDRQMRIGLGRKSFAASLERFEAWLQQNADGLETD